MLVKNDTVIATLFTSSLVTSITSMTQYIIFWYSFKSMITFENIA